MKSLNINDTIKVKLNEVGLAIYADRAKEINKKFEESNIKLRCPVFPERDAEGFVKFQLWDLMKLYGKHLELSLTPPFEDNRIYFEVESEEIGCIKGVKQKCADHWKI